MGILDFFRKKIVGNAECVVADKNVEDSLTSISVDNKNTNVEIQQADVLFNITGVSVTRCCIVPDDVLPARVNQHVMIVRPYAGVLPVPPR